jgi:hypothetical protein
VKLASITIKIGLPGIGGIEASWIPDQPDRQAGSPPGPETVEVLREKVHSGRVDQAPGHMVNLGIALKEQGDAAGAKAAYQRAIDSDDPHASALGAFNLGNLLREEGDLALNQA